MPRQSSIKTTWDYKGTKVERVYRLTFIDDSEERAEAVRFFGRALFPAMNLPEGAHKMPEADVQAILDAHPMQEQWSMLTLDPCRISFENDDLYRLQFLPELDRLHSLAGHLTNRGVSYIRRIPELRHLIIYSPLITDACLEDIASFRHLQTIDLQGSHGITRTAFDRLVSRLPDLADVYPPFSIPLSEVYANAQQKAQNKHVENSD